MALVAYDNSDSSEFEDDESPVVGIEKRNEDTPKPVIQNGESSLDDSYKLFNQLPQPTNKKMTVIEEDDEFLHKKEPITEVIKPKSLITIPSLSDFKDVEDTVPSVKNKSVAGKKSGLLSILPQPKNAAKSTIKSFIPNVLTQKPNTTAKKKEPLPSPAKLTRVESKKPALVTEYSDDSDNEDEVQNDFFSINKPIELPAEDIPLDIDQKADISTQKKEPRSIESYFKKDVDHVELIPDQMEPSQSSEYYTSSAALSENIESNVAENTNTEQIVLDDEAILKLVGARGKRKREEIQIVDVNQQEVLGDSREWLLKGLMDDTSKRQSASKKKGNEPTNQQKRKHQITYLAHQAKANEAELQNQWANNRMSKRQTQSKYGF